MIQIIQIVIGCMPFVLYTVHSVARRPPPPKENVWRWRVWSTLDILAFLTPDELGGSFKLPFTMSATQRQLAGPTADMQPTPMAKKEDNASP